MCSRGEEGQALVFFFSSRRRHTRLTCDWSSACALPISVRGRRARGGPAAARRHRVPALGVHELAAAGVRALGRPVRRALLHPAVPAAGQGARRVRHRAAPAAAGAGDGGPDAERRHPVRPVRAALARRHRPRLGRARHVPDEDLTLETSNTHFVWLLVLRAVGMGLAMMPIMTGGLPAVPPDRVDGASAFNNVTQRTTAALGLAVLTTLVTKSRAQLDADRGALLDTDMAMPVLGPGADGRTAGMYALSQQAQTQVFVDAMHGLFIITAIIPPLGTPPALMLRWARAPAGGAAVPAGH